jgi:small subunit ribosomal protein S5
MVHATAQALKMLETPTAIAARRGKSLEDVAPKAIAQAVAAAAAVTSNPAKAGA